MKSVYRYELEPLDYQEIVVPKDIDILFVGFQSSRMRASIWAAVELPIKETEVRAFETVGTGHTIVRPEHARHIGSYIMPDGFHTFHIFEVLPIAKKEDNQTKEN